MIKNPQINQTVFFIDDDGNIVGGKASKVYEFPSNGAIAVNNIFTIDAKYAFSTRNRAEKYLEACREIDYLVGQRNFYEKLIKKAQNKYESFLK